MAILSSSYQRGTLELKDLHWVKIRTILSLKRQTWTPKIPKIMKKVQQMRTMFPMGFSDDSSVWTTSFNPGALLITLSGLRARTSRKTRRIPKIFDVWPRIITIIVSTSETITKLPSMTFQPRKKPNKPSLFLQNQKSWSKM